MGPPNPAKQRNKKSKQQNSVEDSLPNPPHFDYRTNKKRQRSSGEGTPPDPKKKQPNIKNFFSPGPEMASDQAGTLEQMQKDIKTILDKMGTLSKIEVTLHDIAEDIKSVKTDVEDNRKSIEYNQDDIANLKEQVKSLAARLEAVPADNIEKAAEKDHKPRNILQKGKPGL